MRKLNENNRGATLRNRLMDGAPFYAPRTSSITQTRGAGTPTITRATVATVRNNDGFIVTALSGEIRQQGAMRIRNLLGAPETTVGWIQEAGVSADVTAGIWTISLPGGGADAGRLYCSLGANGASSRRVLQHLKIWADSPVTVTLRIQGNTTARANKTINVTTTPTEHSNDLWDQNASDNNTYFILHATSPVTFYAQEMEAEDVTAQTTQTAGKYVSVGVLSAPYHGAGVDGVKYLNTDIFGNPIPDATLDGALVEAAATQYLGVTGTPATQTTASLDTGTYTLWVEGTGSALASAGTATISGEAAAEEDSHNTFTVSGAGTVTVTVTGSLTFFQLEKSPYPTARIDNAGAVGTSATRNKDVLDDQVSGNLTAAAGSVAFQWTPTHDPIGTVALGGSYVDADNYTAILHDATKYIFRKRIAGTNYDAELTAAYANGTTAKIALYWGASGSNIAVDGVLGTAHANTDPAQLGTRWQWGADGNGGQQAGACFKHKRLIPRALSNSELREMAK